MGFSLEKIVPWGRSYAEYIEMFALTESDLKLRILGCGDDPASFNAELTQRGGSIISIDPLYQFNSAQIQQRIDETYHTVLAQLRQNKNDFIWETIASVEELGRIRMNAMALFLADYASGKTNGRYLLGELPLLPFVDQEFDLALSSHFLFLYSELLSAEFHLQAIQTMLRVAKEVRIFPLLSLNGTPSPHLLLIIDFLNTAGFNTAICPVNYHFQRGANKMLIIKSN